jgi:hypothetical protein
MLSFKPANRVLHQPTFRAVGLIEKRMQQSRPLKVRCRFDEDRNAAQDRHVAGQFGNRRLLRI